MNKNTLALLGAAIMQSATFDDGMRRVYKDGSVAKPRSNRLMGDTEFKSKPLLEYTYKGHTIMAYSKDDARNRLLRQGIIKKK